jgi:hypothetical protein
MVGRKFNLAAKFGDSVGMHGEDHAVDVFAGDGRKVEVVVTDEAVRVQAADSDKGSAPCRRRDEERAYSLYFGSRDWPFHVFFVKAIKTVVIATQDARGSLGSGTRVILT